jgi:hypothetical protein
MQSTKEPTHGIACLQNYEVSGIYTRFVSNEEIERLFADKDVEQNESNFESWVPVISSSHTQQQVSVISIPSENNVNDGSFQANSNTQSVITCSGF